MHAAVETAVYLPSTQAVHMVAPPAVSVSVADPTPQAAQPTVEAAEYLPGIQAVHVVAPEISEKVTGSDLLSHGLQIVLSVEPGASW